jgi:hypothetical protein
VAYKFSYRGSRPVSLITIHTAQGARTARALGNYFWRDDVQASSHVGIDANETLLYVPYHLAAWTLRSGNPISENAELCGFAEWTRAQWLSTDVVNGCVNPRAMVSRAAAWARERALARGIPLQRLTPVQVGQNAWGLIDHYAWTIGKQDGTHTDVGGNFPWDVFMNEVLHGPPVAPNNFEEDHMYFLQGGTPNSPTLEGTNIYLLAGPFLQGLVGGSRADAIKAITERGAPYKWAEAAEIADLDRRSHALLDQGRLFDELAATNAKLDQLIETVSGVIGQLQVLNFEPS